jgi:uncharacterized protein YaaQ
MVGTPDGRVDEIINAIIENSQHRVEFLPPKFNEKDFDASVRIEGATIFFLDVEHYEEL